MNLQANQLLPMFNKAMRKFTNICKATFEQQISKELEQEEQAGKKVVLNLLAQKKVADDDKAPLDDALTMKLQGDKVKFV